VISLPFTSLKVDRALVREAPRAKGPAAAIAALITLGARLGLTVVGEGVETESELDFLRREGCDAVQGHALARPQPAGEMGRLLGATEE
jgi:EAL domain-containing protein (putative c-di-GMP-specific phosphodiesterase class I)